MKQIQKSVPRRLLKSPNRYKFSKNAVLLLAVFSTSSGFGMTLYLRKQIKKLTPLFILFPLRKLHVIPHMHNCFCNSTAKHSYSKNLWSRESHKLGVNVEFYRWQMRWAEWKSFPNLCLWCSTKVLISDQFRAYKW